MKKRNPIKKTLVTALLFLFLLWCSGSLRGGLKVLSTVENPQENLHHPVFGYEEFLKFYPEAMADPCRFWLKEQKDNEKLAPLVARGILSPIENSTYDSRTIANVIRYVDGDMIRLFLPTKYYVPIQDPDGGPIGL